MKRCIIATSNLTRTDDGWYGSAPASNRRKGLVKFSTGDNFTMQNGVEVWLRSAKALANLDTGKVVLSINVTFMTETETEQFSCDYDRLTPEEFEDVYASIKAKTYDEFVEFCKTSGFAG